MTPQDKTAALEALNRADSYNDLGSHLGEHVATIRAALLQTGWRGIESAPRDGQWILAYRLGALIPNIVRWETFKDYPKKFRDHLKPRWLHDIEGDYADDDNAIDCLIDSSYDPTHWQPLPPPPTDIDSGEG